MVKVGICGVGAVAALVLAAGVASAPAGIADDVAGRFTYRTEDSLVAPAGTQTTRKLKCPAGTSVTGGGGYTSGSSADDSTASSAPFDGRDADDRPDDGWLLEINVGSVQASVDVYVICASFGGLHYVSATADVRPDRSKSAHAACPSGTDPLGGGVRTSSASTAVALRRTFPWMAPGGTQGELDGWIGTANNLTTRTQRLTVYGVCKHRPEEYSAPASFSSTTPMGDSAGGPVTVCPDEYHVSGGGAFVDGGVKSVIASTGPDDDNDPTGDPDQIKDDKWFTYFYNGNSTTDLDHGLQLICAK